jgi:hypothetical protein
MIGLAAGRNLCSFEYLPPSTARTGGGQQSSVEGGGEGRDVPLGMDDLGPILLFELGRNVGRRLALDGRRAHLARPAVRLGRSHPASTLERACNAREGALLAAERAEPKREPEHEGDESEQEGLAVKRQQISVLLSDQSSAPSKGRTLL